MPTRLASKESSRPPVARNPINPLPNPGVARILLATDVILEFSFFSQLRADDLRDKIAHRRNGSWNQEAIASPGAAFGRASQGRSLSQSIAVDGGATCTKRPNCWSVVENTGG
jgi:hypothetical protein